MRTCYNVQFMLGAWWWQIIKWFRITRIGGSTHLGLCTGVGVHNGLLQAYVRNGSVLDMVSRF